MVVTAGVAIASYGEINFVVIGVILQLAAVVTESSRLTLVRQQHRSVTCLAYQAHFMQRMHLAPPLRPAGAPPQVQILLQKRGLSLNPITTLYYIAPASFMFLLLPWSIFEARQILSDTTLRIDVPIFVSNAAAAFGLNMSVFLLIGKTSALTMNVRPVPCPGAHAGSLLSGSGLGCLRRLLEW